MADSTKIEWCDSTFNPWTGCTKVSPGCEHCYAEAWSKRAGDKVGKWGPGAPRVRTTAKNWKLPKDWNAAPFYECSDCGWRGDTPLQDEDFADFPAACPRCPGGPAVQPARRRVFCASLADVFDNEVPVQWRRDLFDLIAATPNLDWLLLTKRIGNARVMYADAYLDSARQWPRNVWLGATIVTQEDADRDIPKLLATPARVRFVSMEPLLGSVDLTELQPPGVARTWIDALRGLDMGMTGIGPSRGIPRIDWVIAGGESGHGARPMHPDWVRSLRDQCAAAGVPFHFKQWGEWAPGENVESTSGTVRTAHWFNNEWSFGREDLSYTDGHVDDEPDLYRVGKKETGRLLDGVEHNGFPRGAA